MTAADVLEASSTGMLSSNMRALLTDVGARAEMLYQAEHRLIPLLDADSRAAMRVMVRIYHLLLLRIRRRGCPVFAERVSVPNARKLIVLAGGLMRGLLARRRLETKRT